MASRRALERRLSTLMDFEDPIVELEQYRTPADLAAHVVHLADLRGDLSRTVVDLGAGTGVLALAAAFREAQRVVGIERDRSALAVARENERRVDPPRRVDWVGGDARRAPICTTDATILMNPPFGAQAANAGDRGFLRTASRIGTVSYSVHNAGSRGFVESFAGDNGGRVTDAFGSEIDLDRRFPFHDTTTKTIDVEIFRIDWTVDHRSGA